MNTQERTQLNQLLQQLVEAKITEKHGEAEKLISDAVASQPDAAYLLVQKCLVQDQALQAAQTQITDLQQQLQQKSASTGKGFLHNDPWATSAQDNRVPGASSYQIPSAPSNANFSRTPLQNQGAGFGSSFLGNVASTAAGVAAGSFLFQGIGNLLGHHASPSLWSQANPDGQPGEPTVINNYYGEQGQPTDSGGNDDYLSSNDDDSFLDDGNSDFDSDWV